MLIKGTNLTPATRAEVLNAYGYRWTGENYTRAVKWYGNNGMPRIEVQTDEQWLADHAFYIRRDGHLDARYNHCEPAFLCLDQTPQIVSN